MVKKKQPSIDAIKLKEDYNDGKRGFSGLSLRGDELTDIDLSKANFNESDFSGLNKLSRLNFRYASLREANLKGAKIIDVDFGSSDLSGAEVPNHISENFNSTITQIKEVTKNLQKICFVLIAVSMYIAFTLIHIEDQHLFIKQTQIQLPIVNVKMPSLFFLLPAQLFILIIFLYFQIYRKHIIYLIETLPAVFPNGINRSNKLHPWILLMRLNRMKPEDHNPISSTIWSSIISIFLSWILLPITSILIWVRTLKSQNSNLSILVWVVFFATCFVTCISNNWVKYNDGEKRLSLIDRKIIIICTIIFVITGILTLMGIQGNLFPLRLDYATLEDTNLKKYNLKRANLNDANLQQAILIKVDLKGASLERAKCEGTFFSCANLSNACLNFAKLIEAKCILTTFKGAHLIKANLKNANLSNADFSNTILYLANFSGADLKDAKFHGANLMAANLKGAKNLTLEQIAKAKTLYSAQLDTELEKQVRDQFPNLLTEPKYKNVNNNI